ncbi:unnamed protein product, partial [Urochloa humidicola]
SPDGGGGAGERWEAQSRSAGEQREANGAGSTRFARGQAARGAAGCGRRSARDVGEQEVSSIGSAIARQGSARVSWCRPARSLRRARICLATERAIASYGGGGDTTLRLVLSVLVALLSSNDCLLSNNEPASRFDAKLESQGLTRRPMVLVAAKMAMHC